MDISAWPSRYLANSRSQNAIASSFSIRSRPAARQTSLGRLDDEGRGVVVELVGVRLEPAVLGLLEGEGEGLERLCVPSQTKRFEETEHGWFQAHAYRYDNETSTFIVETPEDVWLKAGLDKMEKEEAMVALREALRQVPRRPQADVRRILVFSGSSQ